MAAAARKNLTVGYARVSTAQQSEEGHSLEAQKRKIATYCDLHDLELIEVIEDAGLSGKSIAGRPGIQRVLDMVDTGKVHNVVVLKLDRLARNLKEACEIANLCKAKKAGLHSIYEKIDTSTATGMLFYHVISAMGEWERETISERTRTVMQFKKSNGEKTGRHAPYGFSHKDGKVAQDPAEQAVISKIRELQGAGYSIRGIAQYLEANGYRNREGKPVQRTQIHRILRAA